MAKLKSMKYGTFTWNNNPSECSYDCDKAYATHKYPEYSGIDIEDFGANAIILSGSGEFFGSNAYKYWDKLSAEFKKGDVRKLYHPIYKDLKYGLMTKLQSSLGVGENHIVYTFEIVADTKLNTKNKAVVTTSGISGPKGTGGSYSQTVSSPTPAPIQSTSISNNYNEEYKIGDIILITGTVYKNPFGTSMNHLIGKKTTITDIMSGTPYPIHFGSATFGWVALESVTKYSVKALNNAKAYDNFSQSTNISDFTLNKTIVHTVKIGEKFKDICAIYGITDWKSVAIANNIKNIGDIKTGQKIRIIKG